MAAPEFALVNGHALRLTSLAKDPATGILALVVIVRGNAARDELTTLLQTTPLVVALPPAAAQTMRVAGLELRSTGDGARTIHRVALTLAPHPAPTEPLTDHPTGSSAESVLLRRLDAIEHKLDRLLALAGDRTA